MRTSRAEPVPRNVAKKPTEETEDKKEETNSGVVHAYPVTTPVAHVKTSKEALHKVRAEFAPKFKDRITKD